MIDRVSKVVRVPSAAWREIDGQVAIVSVDVSRVRVLNDVAGFIWKRCDGATVDNLVSSICAEYNVDESQAERDVMAFLGDLLNRGMVSVERGA
jgi:hypothetical protein